jgi:Rps23 Pro-64 3,4-dihydroxylase Tpa1-like proline 4-hydroxylase
MNLNDKVVLREDIVLFENFLTEEECQNVLKYWEHSVEKGSLPWSPISFYESYASNLPDDEDMIKFGLPRDFFTNLEIKIQEATAIARGGDVKKVSYHAQKWIPGAFANFHSDNSSDGEYNAFERSKWATFLYLNDNFTGGALNFKDHPITVQPKTGMLAAFAGGHHNEHEVQIVKSGDRYTIGSFWDYAESEYSDEKKAQWESEIAQVRAEQEVQFKEWEALKEKGIAVEPRKYEEESN